MRLLILTAIALLATEGRSAESIVLLLSDRTVKGEAVEFIGNSVVLRDSTGSIDTISMMNVEVAGFRGVSVPYPTVPALLKIGETQAAAKPEAPRVDAVALRLESLEAQLLRLQDYHRLHGGIMLGGAVILAGAGMALGAPLVPVLVATIPSGLLGLFEMSSAEPEITK